MSNLGREFNCPNDEPSFDAHIELALGCYVYVLKDENGDIFYVGKGGGAGAGNDRVLHHLEDARKKLQSNSPNISKKIERIHAIWKRGKKVEWEIIRYGLPDSQSAFHVEAAVMDVIGRDKLTNAQGGHDATHSGRRTSSEVYRLSAPYVAPTEDYSKVLIFNIDKGIKVDGRSPYDATRGWWTKTRKHEDATHAVGVVRGVAFCVVEIGHWYSWEVDKQRRGFDGRPYEESGSHELLGKNYTKVIEQAAGYWGRGNWLAVEFFQGNARLLRGKSSTKK